MKTKTRNSYFLNSVLFKLNLNQQISQTRFYMPHCEKRKHYLHERMKMVTASIMKQYSLIVKRCVLQCVVSAHIINKNKIKLFTKKARRCSNPISNRFTDAVYTTYKKHMVT